MSDDTPTQRFDQQGDAPTERLATPAAEEVPLEVIEERKSRKLIIILASIGGALLLAVLIVLVVLLTRGTGAPIAAPTESGTPSASPTPSPTPSKTPSATPTPTPTPTPSTTVAPPPPPPPPPSTGPKINSFNATDEVLCNTQAPNPSPQYIEFTWSSSNVSQVFFGVDTDDASAAPFFTNLPPSGDTSNFPSGYNPFAYPCPEADVKYTLTVVSSNGTKVSKSVIVRNEGDTE